METKIFPIIPSSSAALWISLGIGLILLVLSLLFIFFAYSTRNVRFELSDDGLKIIGGLYGRKIPKDELLISEAKIVNLKKEHQPKWRTNGIHMSGYSEGWFRLSNKQKGLLFVTDTSKVVYIPINKGYDLLISPKQPEEFMAALKTWKK